MQLTVSSDIALRTLIHLGMQKSPEKIQDIATACAVSKSHLMKVIMTLVGAGILASERGRHGGVRLAMAADQISIGLVVKLMENNLALVECMKNTPSFCPLLPQCKLKKAFNKAQEAFFRELDQLFLSDML